MTKFFNEYRRITAKDLPSEMHIGSSLLRCGGCFHYLSMKVRQTSFDKGTFIIYCPSCQREFEQVELEGDELVEFSLEVADRLMGGAA